MANRKNFYTVVYTDSHGTEHHGRTFAQERNARKAAKRFVGYYGNARIMKGGPGGQCICATWTT